MTDTSSRPARRLLRIVLVGLAVQVAIVAASRVVARKVDSGDADDDEIRRLAVMNGVNLAPTSRSFRHARIDLGLGGVDLDLTSAALSPEGATIDLYGGLGGLNLKVPAGWRVTTESDSPSNGFNMAEGLDEAADPDAPHLHVASHARMSGVNVLVV